MSELEPLLRSSHFASWDLSAIRQSDAPGTLTPSPNGFYSEEACLLSRYSGIGSNMRTIGFYNYVPEKDRDEQTAHLCAQMIWYFVDGVMNQYPESPNENKEDFTKFITSIQNSSYQIVFYKSKRTDRWWMEVPINEREFRGTMHIMPCSYNDYLSATREEIPERWLQAVKKFT
jgi:formiminoglutamase